MAKGTTKDEQVGFRVSLEIIGLMDAVADLLSKKTGIRPNRTQIFELAIKTLARDQKVSK